MKKSFKITIEITKKNVSGIDADYRWVDMLFSTSTRTFDKGDIIAKYQEMLKMSKGFQMLTISLTTRRDEGNWSDREETLYSFRFINNNSYTNDIDDIKSGRWDGHSYGHPIGDGERDFLPCTKKVIPHSIEEVVSQGNAAFIEMLNSLK
jgi:hypothetical protein